MDSYSDNLSINSLEKIEEQMAIKVDAQKWCLGFSSAPLYHSSSNGVLQLLDVARSYVMHTAEEDYELDEASLPESTATNSVIEEAKFLKDLGNTLKSLYPGLTFQQFASPMRSMRGVGGTGWTLHNSGEAIDLFYKDLDTVSSYLIANAAQIKLKVIIDYRNQRSWNSKRGTWRSSSNINSGYHHLHIDRGGYRRNGHGLSPEETLQSGVRKIVGGID